MIIKIKKVKMVIFSGTSPVVTVLKMPETRDVKG
jgi:hypothetical protein